MLAVALLGAIATVPAAADGPGCEGLAPLETICSFDTVAVDQTGVSLRFSADPTISGWIRLTEESATGTRTVRCEVNGAESYVTGFSRCNADLPSGTIHPGQDMTVTAELLGVLPTVPSHWVGRWRVWQE